MNNKCEIKPGMLVLWRGSFDAPTLPKERFLGLVVEEIKKKERFDLFRASRQFLVFVRTPTTHDKTAIPIYEHELVPYLKER